MAFVDKDNVLQNVRGHGAAAIVGCFFAIAATMASLKILNLRTNFFDLGQYLNLLTLYRLSGAVEVLASTHLQPFIAPYSLLSALPLPDHAMIWWQAAIIASGGLLLVRFVPVDAAVPVAALFVLSLSAWFNALNDFHFEHLLFPLQIGFVGLLARGAKDWALIAVAVAICMVKEPYALTAAAMGLVAFACGRRAAGAAIVALAAAYFLVATTILIPAYTQGRSTGALWSGSFGHLGSTPFEMAVNLIKAPHRAIPGDPARILLFAGALLAPFLPLLRFAPFAMLPAAPALLIAFVSADPDHRYLGHHYTTSITAALLGALILALPRMKPQARRLFMAYAVAVSAVTMVLFSPAPLVSRLFWAGHVWAYHWEAYVPSTRSATIRALIDRHLPADPAIPVTVQNTLNTARISARAVYYSIPSGLERPELTLPTALALSPGAVGLADYAIVDRRRPLALGDSVCQWAGAAVCADPDYSRRYEIALAVLDRDFEEIASHDGFSIHRRRGAAR